MKNEKEFDDLLNHVTNNLSVELENEFQGLGHRCGYVLILLDEGSGRVKISSNAKGQDKMVDLLKFVLDSNKSGDLEKAH